MIIYWVCGTFYEGLTHAKRVAQRLADEEDMKVPVYRYRVGTLKNLLVQFLNDEDGARVSELVYVALPTPEVEDLQ